MVFLFQSWVPLKWYITLPTALGGVFFYRASFHPFHFPLGKIDTSFARLCIAQTTELLSHSSVGRPSSSVVYVSFTGKKYIFRP